MASVAVMLMSTWCRLRQCEGWFQTWVMNGDGGGTLMHLMTLAWKHRAEVWHFRSGNKENEEPGGVGLSLVAESLHPSSLDLCSMVCLPRTARDCYFMLEVVEYYSTSKLCAIDYINVKAFLILKINLKFRGKYLCNLRDEEVFP